MLRMDGEGEVNYRIRIIAQESTNTGSEPDPIPDQLEHVDGKEEHERNDHVHETLRRPVGFEFADEELDAFNYEYFSIPINV